jgi:hypothetical protein
MNDRTDVQAPSPLRIPGDWTKQKDQEWYKERFESAAGDAYGEAVERLWHERTRLEQSLTEWIGNFLAKEEFDPDPVTECLGASAKADLLLRILQAQMPQGSVASRFEKDLGRAKSAFATCDDVASRYLLQGDKVWLFELGTATEQLAYSGWQLKDSVRGNHEYKLRSVAPTNQVSQ